MLPQIGGVCEISRKEREGPSTLRLKAPTHIYIYILYILYVMQKLEEYMGPVVSTTPCCKLKQQVFLFPCFRLSLWPFDGRSVVARALSSPQQRQQQPFQLQPHECFDGRRHVLLVACFV